VATVLICLVSFEMNGLLISAGLCPALRSGKQKNGFHSQESGPSAFQLATLP
jgi:hypothetical protein